MTKLDTVGECNLWLAFYLENMHIVFYCDHNSSEEYLASHFQELSSIDTSTPLAIVFYSSPVQYLPLLWESRCLLLIRKPKIDLSLVSASLGYFLKHSLGNLLQMVGIQISSSLLFCECFLEPSYLKHLVGQYSYSHLYAKV